MPPNAPNLFEPWFTDEGCTVDTVRVLTERDGGRDEIFQTLVDAAADHVVGLKVIETLGGFPKAKRILRHRIPARKIARSGMLGEILATEYLAQETEFDVPVRRLRYRDTRDQAMRGDDVLGFRVSRKRTKVIKVEAKSRKRLALNPAWLKVACWVKVRNFLRFPVFLGGRIRKQGYRQEVFKCNEVDDGSWRRGSVG